MKKDKVKNYLLNCLKDFKQKKVIITIIVSIIVICGGIALTMLTKNLGSTEHKLAAKLEEGQNYMNDKDYSAAVDTYNEAIEIDNSSVYAYVRLSEAYEGLGQNNDAIATLENAIIAIEYRYDARKEVLDDAEIAYKKLADYYNKLGQSDKTGKLLSKALELIKSDDLQAMYDALDEADKPADDPVVEKDGYIELGSYPTSEVAGNDLTEEVTAAEYNEAGYTTVGDITYKRISATDSYLSSGFGDAEYRYFKCEPITWRILSDDGEQKVLMTESIVDCYPFNIDYENVTWETSDIRTWLNETFYSNAFNEDEQAVILTTKISAPLNALYGIDCGPETEDKVYLLNCDEIAFTDYGFAAEQGDEDTARIAIPTNYANARGTFSASSNTGCAWWLRSMGYAQDSACVVYDNGVVNLSGLMNITTTCGVRPVIVISDTEEK